MKNEKLLTIFMVISMSIWGVSWSSAKVLSGYSDPFTMAFIRVAITFFAYIPLIWITKQGFQIKSGGWKYVVGAGIMLTCYALLFFKGLSLGQSGQGGVIVTTLSPIFAYLITSIIRKRLPGKNELIGLGLGILAGIVLLQLWNKEAYTLSSSIFFFFIAAFTWAMMGVFTSFSKPFTPILPFSWWLHLITLIGLSFFIDKDALWQTLMHGDTKFWLNALYLGILNSAVATTIYLYATSKLGADKAGSFMFIVPVMAVFASWLIMGERPAWNTLVGGLIGILAVMTINGALAKK